MGGEAFKHLFCVPEAEHSPYLQFLRAGVASKLLVT
jgi:hypothetical protein